MLFDAGLVASTSFPEWVLTFLLLALLLFLAYDMVKRAVRLHKGEVLAARQRKGDSLGKVYSPGNAPTCMTQHNYRKDFHMGCLQSQGNLEGSKPKYVICIELYIIVHAQWQVLHRRGPVKRFPCSTGKLMAMLSQTATRTEDVNYAPQNMMAVCP